MSFEHRDAPKRMTETGDEIPIFVDEPLVGSIPTAKEYEPLTRARACVMELNLAAMMPQRPAPDFTDPDSVEVTVRERGKKQPVTPRLEPPDSDIATQRVPKQPTMEDPSLANLIWGYVSE